jgi:hypothetical protein
MRLGLLCHSAVVTSGVRKMTLLQSAAKRHECQILSKTAPWADPGDIYKSVGSVW